MAYTKNFLLHLGLSAISVYIMYRFIVMNHGKRMKYTKGEMNYILSTINESDSHLTEDILHRPREVYSLYKDMFTNTPIVQMDVVMKDGDGLSFIKKKNKIVYTKSEHSFKNTPKNSWGNGKRNMDSIEMLYTHIPNHLQNALFVWKFEFHI